MFGGYDSTLYQDGNNDDGLGIIWFDDSDNSDTYWNLDITNFTWGNYTTTVLQDAYIFNDRYLEIPEDIFGEMIHNLYTTNASLVTAMT